MKVGGWVVGVSSVTLILILVVSAGIAAYLIRQEIRAGGMEDKWVFYDIDSFGNDIGVNLLFVDSVGRIIGEEPWRTPPSLVAIDPEGDLLWRSAVNAGPMPVEGPDGRFYYVDWAESSSGAWSNITALSTTGALKWSYVVPNGTLDLWAIYWDGTVVAHHYFGEINQTNSLWETVIDRVFAISRRGDELWSVDSPFESASWRNPSISRNGTFVVYAQQADGTYELEIGKYGYPVNVQKVEHAICPIVPYWDSYGNLIFEVRKEPVDSETSIVSVYAFSMTDGSQVWRTVLGYSDNPHHMTPGSGYQVEGTLVDPHGNIFCDEFDSGHSYCLDANGTIVWKKPYFGRLIDVFPSDGLLVADDHSIKRINIDGSLVWRHYVELDGYSSVLVASDDTVYYNQGSEVHALARSTGISTNVTLLLVIASLDLVAVASFGLSKIARSRRAQKL